MSELIGAVASVQIRKLPRIVRAMRDSKRRIRRMLEGTAGLRIQRFNDEKGETSCFLMFTVRDAAFAREVVQRMWHAGLRGLSRLADYGMHVYYNVPQLVDKVPLSPSGNPWKLPENARSVYDYRKGACPVADDLFERSIVLSIPSCLTPAQEKATARILRAAVTAP
jgi:8-amino-3,8-dideoxy-alpha-D-manno-octulosonate transaminase